MAERSFVDSLSVDDDSNSVDDLLLLPYGLSLVATGVTLLTAWEVVY